jgi:hypothetical protein
LRHGLIVDGAVASQVSMALQMKSKLLSETVVPGVRIVTF